MLVSIQPISFFADLSLGKDCEPGVLSWNPFHPLGCLGGRTSSTSEGTYGGIRGLSELRIFPWPSELPE